MLPATEKELLYYAPVRAPATGQGSTVQYTRSRWSRLKAGCGQDCPPHKLLRWTTAVVHWRAQDPDAFDFDLHNVASLEKLISLHAGA